MQSSLTSNDQLVTELSSNTILASVIVMGKMYPLSVHWKSSWDKSSLKQKIPSADFAAKIEMTFEVKCISHYVMYFVLYFSLYPCLNCPNTIIACHSRTLRDSRTGVLKKDFQQTFPSIHKYCPILPISISFETTTTLTTTSTTRWQTLLTQKLNFSDFSVQNTLTLFVF